MVHGQKSRDKDSVPVLWISNWPWPICARNHKLMKTMAGRTINLMSFESLPTTAPIPSCGAPVNSLEDKINVPARFMKLICYRWRSHDIFSVISYAIRYASVGNRLWPIRPCHKKICDLGSGSRTVLGEHKSQHILFLIRPWPEPVFYFWISFDY